MLTICNESNMSGLERAWENLFTLQFSITDGPHFWYTYICSRCYWCPAWGLPCHRKCLGCKQEKPEVNESRILHQPMRDEKRYRNVPAPYGVCLETPIWFILRESPVGLSLSVFSYGSSFINMLFTQFSAFLLLLSPLISASWNHLLEKLPAPKSLRWVCFWVI